MRPRIPAGFLFALLVILTSAARGGGAAAPAQEKLPYPDVPRIKAEDVYNLMKTGGNVVFVDTDNSVSYGAEHIKGAVNVVYDPTVDISHSDQMLQALPGDKLLVFYCNCPHEEDSAPMVQEMWQLNYARDKVKALEGGLNRWEELGYPLAGTDLPSSNEE